MKRHLQSSHHKDAYKHSVNETQASVSSFLVTEPLKDRITSAEVKFTVFLAENNLQMATADNASRPFKSMFPDSQIAKKYSCGRTKSFAILNDALAADLKEKLVHSPREIISTVCDFPYKIIEKCFQ